MAGDPKGGSYLFQRMAKLRGPTNPAVVHSNSILRNSTRPWCTVGCNARESHGRKGRHYVRWHEP